LTYQPALDALLSDLVYNPTQPLEEFYRCIPLNNENERISSLFDEIRRCQSSITSLLSQGEFLSKEERTIAILVRENWQAEAIRAAGQKKGFPAIQTYTGGDLYQSVPALEMCNLLQALLWNEPEELAHLLSTNFFGAGCPDRIELYKRRPQPGKRNFYRVQEMDYLTELLDQALSAAKGESKKWDDLRKSLRMSPVLQVLKGIYDLLRPWNRFGQDEWLQVYYHMNVDLLFEKIIQGCSWDNLTLHKLTNFITTNIITRRAEECRWPEMGDEDFRIICTTVHRSKGLEYGYVIMPYASFAIDKPKRNGMDITINNSKQVGYSFKYADQGVLRNSYYDLAQEIEERMREETRILYVAMTRAIRSFAWLDLQASSAVSWQFLLRGGAMDAL
jgi:ATP-dependent exoDNAse (exonuclease V) beta subunit